MPSYDPRTLRPKLSPAALVCCKTRRKSTPRAAVAAIKEAAPSKMRSRVPLGDELPHAEEKLQGALQQEVKEHTFVDFERRMRAMLDQKTAEHRKTNERRAAASRNADPGPISLGAAITAALSKCVPEPPKDCTPVCGRKIDAVTEEDLLLYVLLSSNLALGYSVIL